MKKIKVIVGILVLFVNLPIWYWLMYQILNRVNASELMYFLYWVYVPAGVVASILREIAGDEE